MAGPVALHTFDYKTLYLTTRDNAAPGSGTWSSPSTIFTTTEDNRFAPVTAGAGSQPDQTANLGILYGEFIGSIDFLGNGLPTTPIVWNLTGSTTAISIANGSNFNICAGAWFRNNAYWVIGVYLDYSNPFLTIYRLAVYKSIDAGATWNEVDAGNAPAIWQTIDTRGAAFRKHIASGKIDCVFITSADFGTDTGDIALNSFDIDTELWTGNVGALSLPFVPNFEVSNRIVRFANDDIGIFYDAFLGGGTFYRVWDGATWGSEVEVLARDPAKQYPYGIGYLNIIVDPTDSETVHLFVGTNQSVYTPSYWQVAHAGTITPSIFTFPGRALTDGIGNGSILNAKLFVPYDDTSSTANTNTVWVANLSDGQFVEELLPKEEDAVPCCAYMLYGLDFGVLRIACPLTNTFSLGQFVVIDLSLVTSGGTPPYTWTIIGGALPNGLGLNPSTGIISGIPLETGTFNLTYQVTDSLSQTATAGPCSLTITPKVNPTQCVYQS